MWWKRETMDDFISVSSPGGMFQETKSNSTGINDGKHRMEKRGRKEMWWKVRSYSISGGLSNCCAMGDRRLKTLE